MSCACQRVTTQFSGQGVTQTPTLPLFSPSLQVRVDVTNSLAPLRDGMKKTGCSITGDGWSSVNNRPLQNLLVCSGGESMFLKAVDMTGKIKDAANIAAVFNTAIEELGPKNVVAVITDSAANCKAAGELIHLDNPNITWLPCAAHCLDLALEDIGKLEWVSSSIAQCRQAVKFITTHHMPLAIYRKHSEATEKKLQLLKPGKLIGRICWL
jgi:hypothetical protein